MNAPVFFRTPLPLMLLGSTLLLTACGGGDYKRFATTTPAWKSFDQIEADTGRAYTMAHTIAADGASWRAFNDNEHGRILRKVDSAGIELWRQPLTNGVTHIALSADGAVLVFSDNSIAAYNDAGAPQWQQSPFSSDHEIMDVEVTSDGTVLVGAEQPDYSGLSTIAALNADGSVRWNYAAGDEGDSLISLQLLEGEDGDTLAVESIYDDHRYSGISLRALDDTGTLKSRVVVNTLADIKQRHVWRHADRITLHDNYSIQQLGEDGTLHWIFNPANDVSGSLRCIDTTDHRFACAYQTKEMESVVAWLDENGQVTQSKTFKLDQPIDLVSDSTGRLLLVEQRWPVFSTEGNFIELYILRLVPPFFGTARLHLLTEAGTISRTINLLSGRAEPGIPGSWIAEHYSTNVDHYRGARFTPAGLIVAGMMEDFSIENSLLSRSFVSAYAVE